VYVEGALAACPFNSGQWDLVIDGPRVVGQQIFEPEYAFEIEQAAEKIGLSTG
jgi:hypothetical protein